MQDKRTLILFGVMIPLAALALSMLSVSGAGSLPVYAPALILSTITPLSFGLWFIIFGAVFLCLKLFIATLKAGERRLSGFLEMLLLGLLIDVWSFLLKGLNTVSFGGRIACLLFACLLLAVVVFLQNELQSFVLPADALTEAIAQRSMVSLSNRFQLLDMIGLVLAIILSSIFYRDFSGVGIASFVAPVMVPYFGYLLQQGVNKLDGDSL